MKRIILIVGLIAMACGMAVQAFSATSTTLQSAVAADGVGTAAEVFDSGDVGLEVAITGKANVNFEGSVNGGTTYRGIVCRKSATTSGDVSTTNTSGLFICHAPGLSHIRTPVVGWQTGTVTVTANAQQGSSGAVASEDPPTYTEGDSQPLSMDLSGNLRTTLGTLISGEDQSADVLKVEQRGYYTSICSSGCTSTSPTTTVLKNGPGWFQGCRILGGTLGNITIYDNTAASGTVMVAAFTPATSSDLANLNMSFTVGATLVTAAATNLTCVVR